MVTLMSMAARVTHNRIAISAPPNDNRGTAISSQRYDWLSALFFCVGSSAGIENTSRGKFLLRISTTKF
jgi:hypothetical protein